MIIENVVSWLISILLIMWMLYIVYFNIVHIYSKLKCYKKHYNKYFNRCCESKCKWSRFCEEYEHIYSKEEITKLKKRIDEMKQQKSL